ncbi:hypothetical protein ACWEOZ_33230 [Actinoplanes sp. NPDC004185]
MRHAGNPAGAAAAYTALVRVLGPEHPGTVAAHRAVIRSNARR